MAPATVTFEPTRLREAIADEIDNHWRTLTGYCSCGRSRTKDPAQIRAHIADEVLAVVMRFQRPAPASPEDLLGRRPDHPQQIGTDQ